MAFTFRIIDIITVEQPWFAWTTRNYHKSHLVYTRWLESATDVLMQLYKSMLKLENSSTVALDILNTYLMKK